MLTQEIIAEVEDYAERARLSASTVCVRATGNSRLLARLKRRADQMQTDIERLRVYMAENPIAETAAE